MTNTISGPALHVSLVRFVRIALTHFLIAGLILFAQGPSILAATYEWNGGPTNYEEIHQDANPRASGELRVHRHGHRKLESQRPAASVTFRFHSAASPSLAPLFDPSLMTGSGIRYRC